MPPDPLALACFACWVCFAHLHHQKGPLFLEKNLPTLSSAYGPESCPHLIFSSPSIHPSSTSLQFLIIAIINTKCQLIHIQGLLLPHLQYVLCNDIIYIIIQLQNV